MGAILSLFHGGEKGEKIIIDFENVIPTAEEEELYSKVEQKLKNSSKILKDISEYTGCEDLIRKAISQVSPENEEACWNALIPRVDTLHEFYEFANEVSLFLFFVSFELFILFIEFMIFIIIIVFEINFIYFNF